MDVSPKGDGPGFVAVEDETTLLIPDRSGNKLIFGLQNILANPHVGLIFLIPGTGETLRVNGTAELTSDPAILDRLSARGKPAVVAIRGPHQGSLLPLRQGVSARPAVEVRHLAGKEKDLVRQNPGRQDGRGRQNGHADRPVCGAGLQDQLVGISQGQRLSYEKHRKNPELSG